MFDLRKEMLKDWDIYTLWKEEKKNYDYDSLAGAAMTTLTTNSEAYLIFLGLRKKGRDSDRDRRICKMFVISSKIMLYLP